MYEHIARGIPNNWFTRKIVSLINKHLSAIDSIYRIKIRYRKYYEDTYRESNI